MRYGGARGVLSVALLSLTAAAELGPNPEHEGYPLYQHLCASCHGVQADGHGPRAPALERPPTDLTRLSAGRERPITLDELTRVIDGRRAVRSHGEGPMPVWGEELAADVSDHAMREQARIRLIQSLAEYVLSIQHTPDEPEDTEPPTPP